MPALGITVSISGLVPVVHAPSHEGGADPVSAAGIGAETPSGATTKVSDHNSAAAAHGLNSVAPGSEGALKIGTDAKANLGASTTVEAALTFVDGQKPRKFDTCTDNPNAGVGTVGAVGDRRTDTLHGISYENMNGNPNGWRADG